MVLEEIRRRLLARLEHEGQAEEERLLEMIDEEIVEKNRRTPIPLSGRLKLRTSLFNGLRRLDVLQEFLDDGSVTEIMVNGFDRIFLEKEGKLVKSAASFPPEKSWRT